MAKAPDPSPTFEAALAELEEIVARMESGQLPLSDSLAAYKRGAELLTRCQASLADAQAQVEVLEKGVRKSFEPEGSLAPEGEPDAP
jgi:exodeoxyribonuclease VII small subunit